jgi:hypothetical protein
MREESKPEEKLHVQTWPDHEMPISQKEAKILTFRHFYPLIVRFLTGNRPKKIY